ncbi:hypothetical protein C7477_10767 [Phyllobacterium leguminum]|uniref:Lytic murein transglycosylase n=1 Tax=Phyllobacterium leguminum TaxID=314237 RepID=A0A318T326_9HYPH|nr:hypothetical protein C7477_10767 [Phyllobacterium leguminum]
MNTPLCLARHLPLKGGDWLTWLSAFILQRLRLVPDIQEGLISPLEGEMPGKAEGGILALPSLTIQKLYCRAKLSLLQINPPMTQPARESVLPLTEALPV